MKRIWILCKWFLIIWGAISFVALISIGGCVFWELGPGNHPSDKPASNHDVRFVLNWCSLGDDRIETVVHSYISARSFTGDHLDGYAIRVSRLDASELVYDEMRGGWHRGDDLSGIAKDAVDFAAMWLNNNEMPWFPSIDEIRSPKMYVYISRVTTAGTRITSAQIIFANPDGKMIYYFSAKT